jgi:hypothetical protein
MSAITHLQNTLSPISKESFVKWTCEGVASSMQELTNEIFRSYDIKNYPYIFIHLDIISLWKFLCATASSSTKPLNEACVKRSDLATKIVALFDGRKQALELLRSIIYEKREPSKKEVASLSDSFFFEMCKNLLQNPPNLYSVRISLEYIVSDPVLAATVSSYIYKENEEDPVYPFATAILENLEFRKEQMKAYLKTIHVQQQQE